MQLGETGTDRDSENMTMFHMLHRISNGIMAHASRKQEN